LLTASAICACEGELVKRKLNVCGGQSDCALVAIEERQIDLQPGVECVGADIAFVAAEQIGVGDGVGVLQAQVLARFLQGVAGDGDIGPLLDCGRHG
jgi:hypothetical protein